MSLFKVLWQINSADLVFQGKNCHNHIDDIIHAHIFSDWAMMLLNLSHLSPLYVRWDNNHWLRARQTTIFCSYEANVEHNYKVYDLILIITLPNEQCKQSMGGSYEITIELLNKLSISSGYSLLILLSHPKKMSCHRVVSLGDECLMPTSNYFLDSFLICLLFWSTLLDSKTLLYHYQSQCCSI